MSDHQHEHDHDHSELSETELRVRALESILTEKGYVDPAALDVLIETYEKKVGPRNGARVVARAWSNPQFKAWLMRTVTNACYDELRRKKRRPTTPLEPELDDGDEMDSPRWLADPNFTPEQAAEADEVEHAIQHCLEALPAEFRAVVVLADIPGMD